MTAEYKTSCQIQMAGSLHSGVSLNTTSPETTAQSAYDIVMAMAKDIETGVTAHSVVVLEIELTR